MRSIFIVTFLISSVFPHQLKAQKELRLNHFNISNEKVAASGYDVVSYFTQYKAVKGENKWAVYAEGILYYFSNQENKELFLKNWKKYEPQYGGWCAYAMGAKNEKVEINPETFKILNGKLYLFYNRRGNNTLEKWDKNEIVLKEKADVNWSSIYH